MYGKIHPRTGHEGPESKYWYSFILSLTSALDEGGLSTPRSGRFPPAGGTMYSLYRRMGGLQGQSVGCGKSRPTMGFDPRFVQLVARSYAD